MAKKLFNLKWLIGLALLLSLIPSPKPALAQWPPFNFRLNPVYENGKIKYQLKFFSRVDWPLDHLTIKVPLPEGTRFVEVECDRC
jgi:hypothetical protein